MIDNPDLLNFLQSEEMRATDSELNDERATALSFYRGDLFGDEIDGRSKLRTRDVAEVVDYMTVNIMRVMVAGDKIVEFEPRQPGKEELAQEATDRVHWNFQREQDGYQILHDGIKAGLLEKSGVWKTWVEETFVEQVVMMTADQLDMAENVVASQPVPDLLDVDEFGNLQQIYEVVVSVPGEPKFVDAAVPNEEFFVCPDARSIDTAAYVGNLSRVTLADLAALGYTDLENLWSHDSDGSLSDARDNGRQTNDREGHRTGLNRQVWLREEYCRWPVDGQMTLVRVHRVGSRILSVEPAAMVPYVLWSPFPMPHRLIGQSLADKVLDIQVTRSHMLRQAMDALYIANAPRQYVDVDRMTDETIDDCLDVAPGGIVRGRGPQAVSPLVQPFVGAHAFTAMEIMAGEKEARTGITRMNQGLDADAINKTATGTALMQAAGQGIEEYVARNAANAVGELFEKKLRLMIDRMGPHEFKIDGEVREIVPQEWPADMRFGVRVGLGTGNKDRQLQSLMMLKQAQAEAAQVGLVKPEHVFATAKKLTSVLNLGTATTFFADPATMDPQQDQPSPEMQAKMAEMQLKDQMQQRDLEAKFAMKQFEMEMRTYEKMLDIELETARTEHEASIARDRIFAEMQMAREQIAAKLAVGSMGKFRDGGSLAA